MALDGSVYNVPDSEANAQAFGYPKGGRGTGAFPQVRKLSLVEVGTHEEHVPLTTVLDALAHPARALILLYHERWEIELTFDEQKTHQNPWRVTKPADLRSE